MKQHRRTQATPPFLLHAHAHTLRALAGFAARAEGSPHPHQRTLPFCLTVPRITSYQLHKKMATEYKFVKEPPEEYCCMICAKVLNEPNVTDCCGQHFCQVCLKQWFEKNKRKICPHCRSTSFSYMRYLPLKRKISSFQVYCTYHEQGCDVISTVGELNAHKGVCGFASLVCNQGCGQTVLRKDMPRHCKEECLKRKVQCQHCGKMDFFQVINGGIRKLVRNTP